MKRLFILACANGSGKSTISKALLTTEHVVYVNPDDIAKELNPTDPVAAQIEADKAALRRIVRRRVRAFWQYVCEGHRTGKVAWL